MDAYYEQMYPEHSRTSCSDEHPINADVDGSGCHRCNAITFSLVGKLQAELTLLKMELAKLDVPEKVAFDKKQWWYKELEAKAKTLPFEEADCKRAIVGVIPNLLNEYQKLSTLATKLKELKANIGE